MSTVGDEGAVPACEDCGACCLGGGDRYVAVTGDDYERLGAMATRWTIFRGNRCFMQMHEDRCAALRRESGTGRLLCAIYPWRPQICRDLERGGPACAAEREQKGPRAAELRKGPPQVD